MIFEYILKHWKSLVCGFFLGVVLTAGILLLSIYYPMGDLSNLGNWLKGLSTFILILTFGGISLLGGCVGSVLGLAVEHGVNGLNLLLNKNENHRLSKKSDYEDIPSDFENLTDNKNDGVDISLVNYRQEIISTQYKDDFEQNIPINDIKEFEEWGNTITQLLQNKVITEGKEPAAILLEDSLKLFKQNRKLLLLKYHSDKNPNCDVTLNCQNLLSICEKMLKDWGKAVKRETDTASNQSTDPSLSTLDIRIQTMQNMISEIQEARKFYQESGKKTEELEKIIEKFVNERDERLDQLEMRIQQIQKNQVSQPGSGHSLF